MGSKSSLEFWLLQEAPIGIKFCVKHVLRVTKHLSEAMSGLSVVTQTSSKQVAMSGKWQAQRMLTCSVACCVSAACIPV